MTFNRALREHTLGEYVQDQFKVHGVYRDTGLDALVAHVGDRTYMQRDGDGGWLEITPRAQGTQNIMDMRLSEVSSFIHMKSVQDFLRPFGYFNEEEATAIDRNASKPNRKYFGKKPEGVSE